MSVTVQCINTEGNKSSWVTYQCFGFAYTPESTHDRFGMWPKDIHQVVFKPEYPAYATRHYTSLKEQKGIIQEYLEWVFRLKIVKDRIQLVNPEAGVMSVFSDGVVADVTQLSGPEWVGLFELVRNTQDHEQFVQWVVLLIRAGVPLTAAMWACRVLNLPELRKGLCTHDSYTSPPYADTTPSVVDTKLIKFSAVHYNRNMYKPWCEGANFEGVYYFFHGMVTPSRISHIFMDRTTQELNKKLNAIEDANIDSGEYYWAVNFYKEILAFKTTQEVIDLVHQTLKSHYSMARGQTE